MGARLTLDQLPPKMQAQAMAQLHGEKKLAAPAKENEATPTERRLRQSPFALNKLESAYLARLHCLYDKDQILSQAISLRLGAGISYKPDFFIPHEKLFIEVKGPHAWRSGMQNLKIAASLHTWANFRLVWREKSGEWKFQNLLR